jgi:hypothetical protein
MQRFAYKSSSTSFFFNPFSFIPPASSLQLHHSSFITPASSLQLHYTESSSHRFSASEKHFVMRLSPFFLAASTALQLSLATILPLANDLNLQEFEKNGAIGDTYQNGSTAVTIIDESDLPDDVRELFTRSDNLEKRVGVGCPPVTTRQTNVDRTGVWWEAWSQLTKCRFCDLSKKDCSDALNVAHTTTVTVSAGT